MSRTTAYIALTLTDGLGAVRLNQILRRLSDAEEDVRVLVGRGTGELVTTVGFTTEQALAFQRMADRARSLADALGHRGGYVVTGCDPTFPRLLWNRYDRRAPAFLFVRGNAELLAAPAISIGGSRDASDLALRATADAVHAAIESGKVVVSGGARGVDLAAHDAALAAGGRTIVILPQGLLTYAPPPSIANGLDEGRIAIVSEFPPDLSWSTYAAMQRNKTVVGLGEAFVVAEAGTSGGTKAAADGALTAKVPTGVFAFPERSMPDGNRALIARGAVPIPVDDGGSVDRDALALLPTSPASVSAPTQSSLF